jgi:hypothetical protein
MAQRKEISIDMNRNKRTPDRDCKRLKLFKRKPGGACVIIAAKSRRCMNQRFQLTDNLLLKKCKVQLLAWMTSSLDMTIGSHFTGQIW